MKFTEYFLHMRAREDRASIQLAWIANVMHNPLRTEVQADGRIRLWGYIEEVDKYLRVILLEDGKTVHNAFFDRRFMEHDNED